MRISTYESMQSKEYELRRGPFGTTKKLILSPDFLEYRSVRKSDVPIRIEKSDIIDFKHGMDWIVWYRFTVGRRFMITFKTADNKELRINFASLFGMDGYLNQSYADIVEDIWQFYHQDIVNRHLDRLRSGEELRIKGCVLTYKGIQLSNTAPVMPWGNVSMREYYSYFALHDKDNPLHHARIAYNEYETEILWSIVKTLLENYDSHDRTDSAS